MRSPLLRTVTATRTPTPSLSAIVIDSICIDV
jgi:hypothetical protein